MKPKKKKNQQNLHIHICPQPSGEFLTRLNSNKLKKKNYHKPHTYTLPNTLLGNLTSSRSPLSGAHAFLLFFIVLMSLYSRILIISTRDNVHAHLFQEQQIGGQYSPRDNPMI